jgi:hypothetical protein
VLVLATLGRIFKKSMKKHHGNVKRFRAKGGLPAARRAVLFRKAAISYLTLAAFLMILAFNALATLNVGIINDQTLRSGTASMVEVGMLGAWIVAFLPLPLATYQIGETIRREMLRKDDVRTRFVVRFLGASLPWLTLVLILLIQLA